MLPDSGFEILAVVSTRPRKGATTPTAHSRFRPLITVKMIRRHISSASFRSWVSSPSRSSREWLLRRSAVSYKDFHVSRRACEIESPGSSYVHPDHRLASDGLMEMRSVGLRNTTDMEYLQTSTRRGGAPQRIFAYQLPPSSLEVYCQIHSNNVLRRARKNIDPPLESSRYWARREYQAVRDDVGPSG
jgi:hypothetical protein